MIAEAFKPEHVREILKDIAPSSAHQMADEAYCQMLKASGPSATLRNNAGQIIACAGLLDIEDGSFLWSFISSAASRHKVGLVRAARRLVEIARRPTVATVEVGFPTGCEFLERLGFRYRQELPRFGPAGESYHVYARAD
ncbi:MAG: hypothetical protein V4457_06195 [Pseudomonadota bacterium]